MYPVHREETFRRRDVRPRRGPSRSVGRHQRLRQMRAHGRRRNQSLQPRRRSQGPPRWLAGTLSRTKGSIVAEHVVNCGGLWAREVGRMVGLELPVLAMEHHYLITEDIPGVIDPKVDKFHVIDFEGEIYMRQEGGGMLIGTYEQACQPWSRARDAVGLRAEPAAQRSRPHRAEPRNRASSISPRSARRASERSSTARSPSRRTAIR